MTTMNNTLNTANKPAYITMRNTILNGDSWDFLLDISPLAKEEIVPVLRCLVNGPLDEKYRTPKAWEFIQNVMHDATETLVNFCFDNGKFDHSYTVSLIRNSSSLRDGSSLSSWAYWEKVMLRLLVVSHTNQYSTAVAFSPVRILQPSIWETCLNV